MAKRGYRYCKFPPIVRSNRKEVIRVFKQIGLSILSAHMMAICATGQQTPAAISQQQASATKQTITNEEALKKTVGFLRIGFTKDGKHTWIEGTCFFVFYEDARLGENGGFVYLVTNRHMALPGIDRGNRYPVDWIRVRLNLRAPSQDRESEEAAIPLGGQLHWFFPSDDAVDLAALPILPDQERYDYMGFPVSLFGTKAVMSTNEITEGDPVLFTGYFYRVPGLKKIQPIVREGTLAMIPDEAVDTVLGRPGKLYLADVHVTKGNSGSPIFLKLGGMKNNKIVAVGFPYRLLGVVSGYYYEDSDFNLAVASTVSGDIHGNSGIAMVVPAEEIKLLLDSPALQQTRDAQVAPIKPH